MIDEFLLYYAADRYNLDSEMKKQFSRYRHFTRKAPDEWINRMKGQYIAHRIFKEDGLINKLINHSGLSHLDEDEMEFLRHNQKHPWRFSFSVIMERPAKDFFRMMDVFTQEQFLLYSPGTSQVLEDRQPILWLNLLSFNGKCWETYGIINSYHGFEPEDMLYYASELYPNQWIENSDQFLDLAEKNPVPFMILILKSELPLVFKGGDQFVQITGEFLDDTFNSSSFQDVFSVEYARGVYRFALKDWSNFPHYSMAYYDEKEQLLFLSASTDRGYETLVHALNECGYDLPHDPDFRVNMGMMATMQEILKKDIRLNPYEAVFEDSESEEPEAMEKSAQMDNLNEMLSAIIPDLNAGKKPDVKQLARTYDVDEQTAKELIEELWNKYGSG